MLKNENEILLKASKGDEKAIELLFNEYSTTGFNIAYRIVNRSDIAEDMVMDVFIKIIEKKFNIKENFSAYFFRSIINTSYNYINRLKKENICPEEFNYDIISADDPEKEIEKKELINNIKKALNELTENQRTAFLLIHYEQLSYKEVADIMHLSVKAIESLISRAKKSLQEKLIKEF